MTKFYSLLAVVAMTAAVNAQTSETITITGTNNTALANGTQGDVTYSWDKGGNSNAPKYFTSGSAGRMYAKNTLTLAVPTNNKITKVTIKGAAGGDYLDSVYSIDGNSAVEAPKTGTADYEILPSVEGKTLVFTTGPTSSSGHSRIVSITVTYTSTLAVVDATKTNANLVKNTIVSNELIFGAAAKVSVYNTAGQVVKTAEVAENSRLDVSALPKGTYVVTGLVNGQAVSQKVIKK